MLTADQVLEVSRTAEPLTIGAYELTIDQLIRKSTDDDWDNSFQGETWPGAYFMLKPSAAERIAEQFNAVEPWKPPAAKRKPRRVRAVAGRPQPALPGPKAALPSADVVDAQVVA